MNQFNVLLNGEVIDTVYDATQDPDVVRCSLVLHDSFDANIAVQRVYFTRDEYLSYSVLNGEYSRERAFDAHCRYYSQFDCPALRRCIPFRLQSLLGSTDPYFNDLALKMWDDAVKRIPEFVWKHVNAACSSTVPKGHYRWSLNDGVCLLKQSARNWVNHERNRSSTSSV